MYEVHIMGHGLTLSFVTRLSHLAGLAKRLDIVFKAIIRTTLLLLKRKKLNNLQGRLRNHVIGGIFGGMQSDRRDKEVIGGHWCNFLSFSVLWIFLMLFRHPATERMLL